MTFIGKLLDESHSFLSGLQVKESGDWRLNWSLKQPLYSATREGLPTRESTQAVSGGWFNQVGGRLAKESRDIRAGTTRLDVERSDSMGSPVRWPRVSHLGGMDGNQTWRFPFREIVGYVLFLLGSSRADQTLWCYSDWRTTSRLCEGIRRKLAGVLPANGNGERGRGWNKNCYGGWGSEFVLGRDDWNRNIIKN